MIKTLVKDQFKDSFDTVFEHLSGKGDVSIKIDVSLYKIDDICKKNNY